MSTPIVPAPPRLARDSGTRRPPSAPLTLRSPSITGSSVLLMQRVLHVGSRSVIPPLILVLASAVFLVAAPRVVGVTVTPFGPRFTINENGAIYIAGNNSLTCNATNPNCAATRAGATTG